MLRDVRDHAPLGRSARASPATGTPRSGWTATTGLAWAGGYVGDGVSTTNLAGRTLADLITGRDTRAHRRCRGSGHRSPTWEPEPLRWLGANAGLRAMTWADAAEAAPRTAVPTGARPGATPMMGR